MKYLNKALNHKILDEELGTLAHIILLLIRYNETPKHVPYEQKERVDGETWE